MDADTTWTGAGPGAAARRVAERIGALRATSVLGSLVAVQLAVAAWIAARARHDGWLYGAAGTDGGWWAAASALGRLEAPDTGVSYGLPVLLWPVALATGGELSAVLPAIVLVQAAVAAPAVLLAIYAIAARIGGRPFGYAAGLAWAVAPLLSLAFFYEGDRVFQGVPYSDFRGLVRDVVVPHAVGLAAGPAFASLVVLALSAWLVVRALDAGDANHVLVGGLLAGFAAGIDPANLLFAPAPLLALAFARRLREALVFAGALAPALAALALWRGSVEFAGLDLGWETFRVSLVHFRGGGWSLLVVVWIVVAGAFALVRKAPAKGVLVAAWFGGFLLTAASTGFGTVRDGSLLRELVPAFPAFSLLAAGVLLLVPGWGRPHPASAVQLRPPRPTRGVALAVLLLALYPLVMAALARTGGS